jgi:hypothetical protein
MSGLEIFIYYVSLSFFQMIFLYIIEKVGYLEDTEYDGELPETTGEMILFTMFAPLVFVFFCSWLCLFVFQIIKVFIRFIIILNYQKEVIV